uniref:NAD(P)-binding domain-containing protein n=1 Tax=Aplanochytrium stocchinoi TaxID=215587 RepID=A0A7S3PQK1_9STRA
MCSMRLRLPVVASAILIAIGIALQLFVFGPIDNKMFRERVKTGGRSALLLGSTGATGKYVLKELLERDEWTRIVLVGRRAPTDLKVDDAGKQVDVIIADLVKPLVELTSDDLAKLQGVDHVFNCIGTTRAKAGGK